MVLDEVSYIPSQFTGIIPFRNSISREKEKQI